MAQTHGGPTAQAPTETVTPAPDDHVAQLFGRDSLYMLMWAVQIVGAAVLTPVTTRVLGLSSFGTVPSAHAPRPPLPPPSLSVASARFPSPARPPFLLPIPGYY